MWFPPASMKLLSQIFGFCSYLFPLWNTTSVALCPHECCSLGLQRPPIKPSTSHYLQVGCELLLSCPLPKKPWPMPPTLPGLAHHSETTCSWGPICAPPDLTSSGQGPSVTHLPGSQDQGMGPGSEPQLHKTGCLSRWRPMCWEAQGTAGPALGVPELPCTGKVGHSGLAHCYRKALAEGSRGRQIRSAPSKWKQGPPLIAPKGLGKCVLNQLRHVHAMQI